jgi:DNA repair protein RadC
MLCAVKGAKMIIHEPVITYSRKEIPALLIEKPTDILPHLREFFALNITDPTREYCFLTVLNNKGYVLTTKILTVGIESQVLVSSKDVLRQTLLCGGASFILSHNHPSGQTIPSSADLRITRILREAANVLEIQFIDHIILGEEKNDPNGTGFYSFRDAGYI